jgi:hypothetical protein
MSSSAMTIPPVFSASFATRHPASPLQVSKAFLAESKSFPPKLELLETHTTPTIVKAVITMPIVNPVRSFDFLLLGSSTTEFVQFSQTDSNNLFPHLSQKFTESTSDFPLIISVRHRNTPKVGNCRNHRFL